MGKKIVAALFAAVGVAACAVAQTQDLAAVTLPGANIQRTMRLLEESAPLKRNTVRVLFYGQSITCQDWWKEIAQELLTRYPHADLRIENRAIGGFGASELVKIAEHDLYPFYPDLLIFHDYGCSDNGAYEAMIRRTRERTTSEILLITHHDIGNEKNYEESKRIREIAVKYNCGLIDMERHWQALLKKEKLTYKDLLSSGPHLNATGNVHYAGFVRDFLKRNPKAREGVGEEAVQETAVYRNHRLKPLADGSIEIPFTGNRVDALPFEYDYRINGDAVADILIDGLKPSSFPEAYAVTRPGAAPYVWWPAFKVLRRNAAPVAETWELTVLENSPDGKRLRFRVAGSVTGEDGEGTSGETFVSKSGRVVIGGGKEWTVAGALSYRKKEMPAGYRVSWSVVPRFRDVLAYPDSQMDGTDNAVTLVEGIANGPHVLRIVPRPGHALLKLRAIRVYRPPQEESGETK